MTNQPRKDHYVHDRESLTRETSDLSLKERMQALIDAGLAEWNGRKPEPVERVSLSRDDVSMTDIISEMRE